MSLLRGGASTPPPQAGAAAAGAAAAAGSPCERWLRMSKLHRGIPLAQVHQCGINGQSAGAQSSSSAGRSFCCGRVFWRSGHIRLRCSGHNRLRSLRRRRHRHHLRLCHSRLRRRHLRHRCQALAAGARIRKVHVADRWMLSKPSMMLVVGTVLVVTFVLLLHMFGLCLVLVLVFVWPFVRLFQLFGL